MMLRRYFNEDDFQDEYTDPEDDQTEHEEGEFIQYIGKDDLLGSIQDMEIFEMNFNAKVLKMAIGIAEKNWFWKFYNARKKMVTIQKIFTLLGIILMPIEDSSEEDLDLEEE